MASLGELVAQLDRVARWAAGAPLWDPQDTEMALTVAWLTESVVRFARRETRAVVQAPSVRQARWHLTRLLLLERALLESPFRLNVVVSIPAAWREICEPGGTDGGICRMGDAASAVVLPDH